FERINFFATYDNLLIKINVWRYAQATIGVYHHVVNSIDIDNDFDKEIIVSREKVNPFKEWFSGV
ncbi:MAG: hypothetical protein AAFN93_22440, partial [Bacteroidota bacterium]